MRPGEDAGIFRVRAGSGFRYADADGGTIDDDDRERIHDLVIPPAWQDVWISADPHGHIQAVGTDDAGRRQYLYHERWRARRDRGKFTRALALAAALPRARGRVTTALRGDGFDRDRALAVAFRVLDSGALRMGSSRYLERHGSRGLTTLQVRDAAVEASVVTLSFPGKSGKRALIEIDDDELARAVSQLARGRASAPLLWHRKSRRRVALTPSEVNGVVKRLTGGAFTAKDFRTLHGTVVAAEALARIGPVDTERDRARAERLAVKAAAEALGNTPAVARASYIDPRVFARYARGETLALDVSRESAIRALLSPMEAKGVRRRRRPARSQGSR